MDIKPPKKPNQPNDVPIEPDLHSLANSNASDSPQTQNTKPTEQAENRPPDTDISLNSNAPKEPMKKKRFNFSKKQKIIAILIALLLIGGALILYFVVFSDQQEQTEITSSQIVEEPKVEEPPKYYSPLTGLEYATEEPTKRPVTAVMVENSSAARPQSGLAQADLVLEAIAESGVTRFMAVYQESQPEKIGPVRSARPYYVDYTLAFDASYGHVGGSPEALRDIRNLGVKDLDEFANASTYWRATDRYAPHNAYTSFERLNRANQQKGYTSSEFTPFERKIDVPQTAKASRINVNISGPNYNSVYTYDAATNSYLRNMAGSAHNDAETGKQINPKVLVAIITDKGIGSDGYHTTYKTVGSGKVLVFQDGIVSEGTWSKNDRSSSLNLTDKYGLPLRLNAGKTWITLLGSTDSVRYSN